MHNSVVPYSAAESTDSPALSFGRGETTSPTPPINFRPVSEFVGWDKAFDWISSIVATHRSVKVLEIGCGANPTLPAQAVRAQSLQYTANDISKEELDKADMVFDRWVFDLSKGTVPTEMKGRFDLVFSRMVNEHVANGQAYHSNIFSLLRPGGIAAHAFSTLYAAPFIANRLLPEFISAALLSTLRPRDLQKLGKFPARYSWSRGPSSKMLVRLARLGYRIIEYTGYFGHTYYKRLPILPRLEALKTKALLSMPIPSLCSYAVLVMKKSEQGN